MTAQELSQVLSELSTPWWQVAIHILSVIIPIGIALGGYCHNWKVMKRTLEANLTSQLQMIEAQKDYVRLEAGLSKMIDIPSQLWNIADKAMTGKGPIITDYLNALGTIFCYGSLEAITIATELQKVNFRVEELPFEQKKVFAPDIVALLLLLQVQIRKDVSAQVSSAIFWIRLTSSEGLSTEDSFQNKIAIKIREIGSKLKLDPSLYALD